MRFRRNSAPIIRDEVKDPRIHPMTSVMAVEVAPDLEDLQGIYQCPGQQRGKGSNDPGPEQGRGIYQKTACKKSESEKYTGDPFYSG